MDINALRKAQALAALARQRDAAEREAWLRAECDDPTLISQVLALLEQDSGHAAQWQSSMLDPQRGSLAGLTLGTYELKRLLGSGGMGEVYLAQRNDAEFQHQVAIKLVRASLLSDTVRARLRTERQILANLKHPYIATLLDGGTAPDGTPYLVMEYIDGVPIDVYCDRECLSLAARLELFRKVCEAVHYAHQHLIVHRDLKPANILVNAQREPKLLDFGIAKLLEAGVEFRDVTMTQHDVRVLTPANASPEQIRGEAITTASDVYGLGILLYELLCGRRPWVLPAQQRLSELERLICHTMPAPPSAMVERSLRETPDFATTLAQCRGLTVQKLKRTLKGDLDNVVMMALRKEPTRRYVSAQQFAADVEQWLQGQPVIATRDSWRYRSGKFARRHALSLGAATLAVLMLGSFATLTYLQSKRIAQQRDVATAERTRAEQVSSFLVQLFEFSDPSHSRGNELKARELLDTGVKRLDDSLSNLPGTRGTLQITIGRVYGNLGLYEEARATLLKALQNQRQAHAGAHDDVATALRGLGDIELALGNLDVAEQYLNEAQAMITQLHGASSIEQVEVLLLLGQTARADSDFQRADVYLRRALGLCNQHQEKGARRAAVLSELGRTLSEQYRDKEAEPLFREALHIQRALLGDNHPHIASELDRLAETLQSQRKFSEAEPLFQEALALNRRMLGADHPETGATQENYGRMLLFSGQLDAAQAAFEDAMRISEKNYGREHAFYAYNLVNLGMVAYERGEFGTARERFGTALDIYSRTLNANHVLRVGALNGLGRSMIQQHEAARAVPLLEESLTLAREYLGDGSAVTEAARTALGLSLLDSNASRAREMLTQARPVIDSVYGSQSIVREMHAALQSLGVVTPKEDAVAQEKSSVTVAPAITPAQVGIK